MLGSILSVRRLHRSVRFASKIVRIPIKIIGAFVRAAERLEQRAASEIDQRAGSETQMPRALVPTHAGHRGFWTFGRRSRGL
jgi:hypothetical protein